MDTLSLPHGEKLYKQEKRNPHLRAKPYGIVIETLPFTFCKQKK